jgi:hypothetical protein
MPMMNDDEKKMVQTYKAIECNTIVGVICLVLAGFFPKYRDLLYISFSLSFAVHLANNTCRRLINFQKSNISVAITLGLVKAIGFIALPAFAITKMDWFTFTMYLTFMAITMPFAVALNKKYNYKKVDDTTFNVNKILVGAWVAVFTVILLLVESYK